jgi:hypothetical protein
MDLNKARETRVESNIQYVQPNVQPNVQPYVQPYVQSNVQPNVQSNVQPNVQPNVQRVQPNLDQELEQYFNKLNSDIGRNWWKKYISSAFWNNISTPINLTITILTTLTTGQVATNGIMSKSATIDISVATLIISTLNTFFRPNTQYPTNLEEMKQWGKRGIEFEEISMRRSYNSDTKQEKIEAYEKLLSKINELKRTQGNNFITDLIHVIARKTCIKKENWIKKVSDIKQDEQL